MAIKTLIVPVQDFGIVIEQEMGHLLLDSLPGLYTPASRGVIPLQQNRKSGFVRADENKLMGISPDDGRIVLSLPETRFSPTHERTRGTVGVCIVKDYINALIDGCLKWVEVKIPFATILDAYLIHPEDYEKSTEVEERIRGILQDLTSEVCNFIGQDDWYIYHTTQVRFDLRIDKVEDFRIHEYMRLKREGVI